MSHSLLSHTYSLHLSEELLSVPPQNLQGCCMLPAPLLPCHPTPFPKASWAGSREDRHQVGPVTFLNTHGEPFLVPLPLRHFPVPGSARGRAGLKKSLPLTMAAWDSTGPGVLWTPPTIPQCFHVSKSAFLSLSSVPAPWGWGR